MQPDQDKVNQSNDDNIKYLYYLLKVTYNNDLEQTDELITTMGNENPEYVNHPDKALLVTNQILSGSHLSYYDSIFDLTAAYRNEPNATTEISNNNY